MATHYAIIQSLNPNGNQGTFHVSAPPPTVTTFGITVWAFGGVIQQQVTTNPSGYGASPPLLPAGSPPALARIESSIPGAVSLTQFTSTNGVWVLSFPEEASGCGRSFNVPIPMANAFLLIGNPNALAITAYVRDGNGATVQHGVQPRNVKRVPIGMSGCNVSVTTSAPAVVLGCANNGDLTALLAPIPI